MHRTDWLVSHESALQCQIVNVRNSRSVEPLNRGGVGCGGVFGGWRRRGWVSRCRAIISRRGRRRSRRRLHQRGGAADWRLTGEGHWAGGRCSNGSGGADRAQLWLGQLHRRRLDGLAGRRWHCCRPLRDSRPRFGWTKMRLIWPIQLQVVCDVIQLLRTFLPRQDGPRQRKPVLRSSALRAATARRATACSRRTPTSRAA